MDQTDTDNTNKTGVPGSPVESSAVTTSSDVAVHTPPVGQLPVTVPVTSDEITIDDYTSPYQNESISDESVQIVADSSSSATARVLTDDLEHKSMESSADSVQILSDASKNTVSSDTDRVTHQTDTSIDCGKRQEPTHSITIEQTQVSEKETQFVNPNSSTTINVISSKTGTEDSAEPYCKRLKMAEDVQEMDTVESQTKVTSSSSESDIKIGDTSVKSAEKTVSDLSNISLGSSVLEGETVEAMNHDPVWDNNFTRQPKLLCSAWKEYETPKENFLKGCKWSPDGTCFLTNSDDNYLRLFTVPHQICQLQFENIPEMRSCVNRSEGELIYDYCWLPTMNSAEPVTARFFSTSRDAPVHMWDAFTGKLVGTYRAFNHVDELTSAHSLALNPDGSKLYCGFNKMIRVFDVNRPGKQCKKRQTFVKTGQSGIISCIDISPTEPGLYAAGSYSRTVALYTEPEGSMFCMFQGQAGGVTTVKFSPDGNRLYSGGRKDPEILCWDVRNPGRILYTLERNVSTNQRVYFDIDMTGQYIISGGQDGQVLVWDSHTPPVDVDGEPMIQPCLAFKAHNDCVNGVSLHPTMPVIATSSGQRHFDFVDFPDSESEEEENSSSSEENCVKLWWVGGDVPS